MQELSYGELKIHRRLLSSDRKELFRNRNLLLTCRPDTKHKHVHCKTLGLIRKAHQDKELLKTKIKHVMTNLQFSEEVSDGRSSDRLNLGSVQ